LFFFRGGTFLLLFPNRFILVSSFYFFVLVRGSMRSIRVYRGCERPRGTTKSVALVIRRKSCQSGPETKPLRHHEKKRDASTESREGRRSAGHTQQEPAIGKRKGRRAARGIRARRLSALCIAFEGGPILWPLTMRPAETWSVRSHRLLDRNRRSSSVDIGKFPACEIAGGFACGVFRRGVEPLGGRRGSGRCGEGHAESYAKTKRCGELC